MNNPSTSPKQSFHPWAMLLSRSLLFLGFQLLAALAIGVAGTTDAFAQSAKWWPVGVFAANIATVILLIKLYRREGLRYRDIFRINKATIKSDVLTLLAVFPLIGALGFFPNILLGRALFGDPLAALAMYIRPLPLWATLIAVALFPITQGLAELPAYFAYAMPRLEQQTGKGWLALGLAGLALSSQHIFAPLVADWRFIAWRGLMFLPFALATGALLRWKPRLLPYMALVHILMDFSLAPYFLAGL